MDLGPLTKATEKLLEISVDELGAVQVSVRGEKVGLIQELSFRASSEPGDLEAVFRFPPDAVFDASPGLQEAHGRYVGLLDGIQWASVAKAEGEAEDSPLVKYFLGTGTDGAGRTLAAVMAKDDSWHERSHDAVQWMLPTRRPSEYELDAPTLTEQDVRTFAARRDLREIYLFAVDRMSRFLELDRMCPSWVRPKDHNHKKIARMIRSLSELGFRERASRVLEQVLTIDRSNPGVVDPVSVEFWKKAYGR